MVVILGTTTGGYTVPWCSILQKSSQLKKPRSLFQSDCFVLRNSTQSWQFRCAFQVTPTLGHQWHRWIFFLLSLSLSPSLSLFFPLSLCLSSLSSSWGGTRTKRLHVRKKINTPIKKISGWQGHKWNFGEVLAKDMSKVVLDLEFIKICFATLCLHLFLEL